MEADCQSDLNRNVATHLSFGLGNVGDASLYCDHSLRVKAADVADGADGDLGVGVLHDLLDRRPALPNYSAYQVVVCKNLKIPTLIKINRKLLFQDIGNKFQMVKPPTFEAVLANKPFWLILRFFGLDHGQALKN